MKKVPYSGAEKSLLLVPFIMKKSKNIYVAECIDLNIVTQGKTLSKTRKNIIEAIKLHLKSAEELGFLEKEIEKLGGVKKNNKIEVPKPALETTQIEIPC